MFDRNLANVKPQLTSLLIVKIFPKLEWRGRNEIQNFHAETPKESHSHGLRFFLAIPRIGFV